ncbi:MAG: hypothetical protein B5M53_02495 [Candidatus Cloacimonas sp. 4484_209]|nr:MAG: hypothetical protein B5M53_02495 [Candidatus Cloacimonas sp. 4484_209]
MTKRLLLVFVISLFLLSVLGADVLKVGNKVPLTPKANLSVTKTLLKPGETLLEPSSKPVIISSSIGDPSNPFGRSLDTLYYDDGTAYWAYQGTSNALFWAVRFTPAQPCTVKTGIFQVWVVAGTAPVCTTFVWDDNAGTPGNMVDGPLTVQTTGYPSWDRADFTGGYIDGDDFWVGYWLPWYNGSDTTYALTDNGSNYGDRQAIGVRAGSNWNWSVNPGLAGDLMIRAIVAYGAGVEQEKTQNTSRYEIKVFPNPITSKALINYSVPSHTDVKINIYDVAGNLVRNLVNSKVNIGTHSTVWDRKNMYGREVPQGVYLYNFITPAYRTTGKIIVIK